MMKRENKKSKSIDDYQEIILNFYDKKKKVKLVQDKFDLLKKDFYKKMDEYFSTLSEENNDKVEVDTFNKRLIINKIQKVNISFDIKKLEKKLGKKNSAEVINKRYEIVDMEGLIAYLKECDVDPKIFKSFVFATKSINTKELDRLGDLGKIDFEELKDCYTTIKQNPYYSIKEKKKYD